LCYAVSENAFVERGLAGVRLEFPLVPAQAGIQRWVPADAGPSGYGRRFGLAATFIAALALSACGRAGPLELPPGPAIAAPSAQSSSAAPGSGSEQENTMRTGFDAQGNPVAAAGQKKPFILDPLLQ
jgi:predicted small lipoprotein YifL